MPKKIFQFLTRYNILSISMKWSSSNQSAASLTSYLDPNGSLILFWPRAVAVKSTITVYECIFILLQAYNLLQLSYFSSEKLGRIDGVSGPEGSSPSVANGSYPSVIHPPHLDPELYHLYQDVTICINISVIISTTLAIVALCQV